LTFYRKLNSKRSEESKQKFSEIIKGENHPFFGKSHFQNSKDKISQTMGTIIYLYSLGPNNKPNQLLETFPSSKSASKNFNTNTNTIMKYARSNNIFRDQYILSLEPLNFNFVYSQPTTRNITVFVYSLDCQLLQTLPSLSSAIKFFSTYSSSVLNHAQHNYVFQDKYILSLKELSSSTP
jgi:hypothetical protein